MKKVKTQVSLNDFNSAKRSVGGRLSRLRSKPRNWRYGSDSDDSPIEKIGVFESEIQMMETTLQGMKNRLNNATVTIEI